MDIIHDFEVTVSAAGFVFDCAGGCDRRLVVDRERVLTVIHRGDPWALHRGGTAGVELTPPAVTPG
ncbi:hypothetical protein [Actinoplanes sp. NPDC049802]|uniref:hypothetical protein n=1 Tax=Actinoplanes sp. NPDC049802 TaxID=3154742 RepID=UPI0033CE6A3D